MEETTDRAWLRTFTIEGRETSDTTYRTAIVEHFTPIAGRTFLDLGAADGYESRALAKRGAARTTAIEGKDLPYRQALAARDELALPGHDVLQLDVRRLDEHGLDPHDVVLCFGLLYHLENPLNVLARIRNLCGELLLLETHVAPRDRRGLLPKHRELPADIRQLELDGTRLDGLVVPHQGAHGESKGSLDSPASVWLTQGSLAVALTRAGFAVEAWYFHVDETCPEVVQRFGPLLGFGPENTKVWVVARPIGAPGRVREPSARVLGDAPRTGLLGRFRR